MLRSIGGHKAVLALLLAFLLALTLGATAYAQEDEGEGGSDDAVTDVLSDEGEATDEEGLPEGDTEVTGEDTTWSENLSTDSFGLVVTFSKITLTADGDQLPPITVGAPFNHGSYVSALAHEAPKGPLHGSVVSLLAKSDVGKKGFVPESSDTGGHEGEGEVDPPATEDMGDDDTTATPETVAPAAAMTAGAKAAKVGKAEKLKPAKSQAVAKQKPAKQSAKSSASKGKKK